MTTDELGLDKPGVLTRYFAKRWLIEPSAKGEEIIAWLLEAALGKNAMYFIEKTNEYVDAWKGIGEVVPVDAFDGFAITGDPIEDLLIPHAVLVWTCMNDQPWPEEVYHRWLDELLAAGSAEAAYLAASLWPAHDLMAKVSYRPAAWLVHRGQLDAEAERLILTEMLKGCGGPKTSLYGSFEYDDHVEFPNTLPNHYIYKHGFTHQICGLVDPTALEWGSDLKDCIQAALSAPSWSEEVKGAAMLLYLSLKASNKLGENAQEILDTLEQNLFKLDERHINIINFHMNKIEKIDYNLLKDYMNHLIILCNTALNEDNLSIKIFSKYISIGIKTNDILYIGKKFRNIIFELMLKEKEKVKSWLEKQTDDLRIKDLLFATCMSKITNYITIDGQLKTEQAEKIIEDIYGKIGHFDKIRLFIDQARIYFDEYRDPNVIYDFIGDILKREEKISFSSKFIWDYEEILHNWHPKRYFLKQEFFLDSNHIGLYIYYSILKKWKYTTFGFIDHIKGEKEIKIYSKIKDIIIENLYIHAVDNIAIKINLYLNKIESNNLPYKEVKYKLINELIDIMENNCDKILEYFKDESKLEKVRKVILYNIDLFRHNLRNSRLIELFGINIKSQNMVIY